MLAKLDELESMSAATERTVFVLQYALVAIPSKLIWNRHMTCAIIHSNCYIIKKKMIKIDFVFYRQWTQTEGSAVGLKKTREAG